MRKWLAIFLGISSGPLALASVSVSAPANGSNVATTVQFVATASSSCSAGVSAVGVYSAPGDLVYSTPGSKLDTSLFFNPGTYKTVVQEWDNCGGSTSTPVTIHVSGAAGGQVTVTAPKTNTAVGTTVQYVASSSTSCSSGVSAIGVYSAPGKLIYTAKGSSLNASLTFSPGTYNTVVQEWDNCGGSATAPVTITVGGSSGTTSGGKVFSNLHLNKDWNGAGMLPPVYAMCTGCEPKITWSMEQNISSPSVSGASTRTSIGGDEAYSDGFWNNHLIGDYSTQGLPDSNKTLNPTLHSFTYDVYFYGTNLSVSQALEFDINQFVGGQSFIWGHECRIAGGHEWDIWDDVAGHWHPTGVACNPVSNAWNHLTIQVERTSSNQLLFKSITLNGNTANLNYTESPTSTGWYGVTINYQQDGNYAQTPYSVWLDKLNFTYQ